MQVVGISDVYSQTLTAQLGAQSVTLNLYQLSTAGVDSNGQPLTPGFFMDVLVNGLPIVQGVACENQNRIVRDPYLGFVGDLCWEDTHGASDPSSPGLGSRFQLVYLEAQDVAGRG